MPTQLEGGAYVAGGADSLVAGGEGSSYGSSSAGGGLVGFPGASESDAMHDSLMLQRLHARRFNSSTSSSSGHTAVDSISSSSLNNSMHSTYSGSNSSYSRDTSSENLRDTIRSGSFGSNLRETIRSGANVRSNDLSNSGSISRGPSKGRGSEMTVQELKELTQVCCGIFKKTKYIDLFDFGLRV